MEMKNIESRIKNTLLEKKKSIYEYYTFYNVIVYKIHILFDYLIIN